MISLEKVNLNQTIQMPNCTSSNCIYKSECAQHDSAGDFRTEDGLTPDLKVIGGIYCCDQKFLGQTGAMRINTKKGTYKGYLDYYYESRENYENGIEKEESEGTPYESLRAYITETLTAKLLNKETPLEEKELIALQNKLLEFKSASDQIVEEMKLNPDKFKVDGKIDIIYRIISNAKYLNSIGHSFIANLLTEAGMEIIKNRACENDNVIKALQELDAK